MVWLCNMKGDGHINGKNTSIDVVGTLAQRTNLSQGILNGQCRLVTVAKIGVGIDGVCQGHDTIPGVKDQLKG